MAEASRRSAASAERSEGIARWSAWGLFFTLMATAGAAVAAYRSAKAAEDAVKKSDELLHQAQEASQQDLMAYVTVSEGRLLNIGTDEPLCADIKIRNGGKTPAYDVMTNFSIRGDEHPLDRPILEIPDREEDGAKYILGPGELIHIKPSMKIALPQQIIDRIRAGTSRVWVTGRIDYVDAFGTEQWTTVRLFCEGAEGAENGGLHPHGTGNDASQIAAVRAALAAKQ
jgi:hypothetical protein